MWKMRATGTNYPALVVAAQAGDRQALDDLVAAYLPLVYTIVRRALRDDRDVDDVVQETMLRALRELSDLRSPASFQAWLAAITVRQVGTHLHRRRLAATRTAALDDLVEAPDASAEFEKLTLLRVDLSGQRRLLTRASSWLDPDDRVLLSLWWLETAGVLTRTELAEAVGVSVAHAGVRVQRMLDQLDLTRGLQAALEARPRCPDLAGLLSSWHGSPNSVWRKRIARHTRSCERCRTAADGMVAADRLLVGLALLPVPVALTAGILGKFALSAAAAGATAAASGATAAAGTTAAKVGVFSQLVKLIAGHPIAAALVAGTVVTGAVATTTTWPTSTPSPTTIAASSAAPRISATRSAAAGPAPVQPTPAATATLTIGRVSLEAANRAGTYVATTDTYGFLISAGPDSGSQTRQQATFEVVAGLADAACFSFRLPDGRYLRHSSWRLRVYANDGSQLFRGDVTFCVRPGAVAGSIYLESSNYPGWFLRHRDDELWVDQSDGTPGFLRDASFRVHPPL